MHSQRSLPLDELVKRILDWESGSQLQSGLLPPVLVIKLCDLG